MIPKWFVNLPLRAKFVTVTMLVGTVVTAFATASFLIYASSATRAGMVREMSALVLVLAENTSAALVFNDPMAATDTLSALRVKSEVVGVRVVRPTGERFAEFGMMPVETPAGMSYEVEGAHFGDSHLFVRRPIKLDGEVVGVVELAASLDVLRQERNILVMIAGAIALVSTLIAFALSSTLQRALIGPITHLADVMRRVSAEKAYARRAQRETNDELGGLITGFNHMLEQIEAQHGELVMYRAQLEQLVQERTAQLQDANIQLQGTVAELRESKADLEAANRTKSAFLANMSHELRTPLNAIIGFSQIMVARMFGPLGDPRYETYVSDISQSASHLIDVISEILDMTRVETGKLELHEATAEVRTLIDDALRIVAPLMRVKGLHLEAPALPTPGPQLNCDPVRVRQILINLLANAVKFTNQDGTVTIRVRSEDGLHIDITDTGIGIPKADLDRVLTPFGQVENAYARQHQGAGLGLSLSKSLMEHHQGTLELDSELGKGTRVSLHFPASRLAA
jgi:signal transduction histidine kinase